MAAAYFKWEQEVPRGTIKLLRSGIRKLEPYRPVCLGVDVTAFLSGIGADLADVEAWCGGDGPVPELRIPRLSPRGPAGARLRASRE